MSQNVQKLVPIEDALRFGGLVADALAACPDTAKMCGHELALGLAFALTAHLKASNQDIAEVLPSLLNAAVSVMYEDAPKGDVN